MFKVALINPPERVLDDTFKHYLPFALLYLAAYLESHGIQADIIDVKPESTYIEVLANAIVRRFKPSATVNGVSSEGLWEATVGKIVREVMLAGPDFVGISCMTAEYASVMRVVSLLKKNLSVPIVAGGIHASLYPEQFIFPSSPFDFVVIGEGEETLLELTQALETKSLAWENIPGIAFLKEGECFITPTRCLPQELRISPVSMYSKLNMNFYCMPHSYVTRHVRISGIQVFTSRGCPFKCTFCSNEAILKFNKKLKPVRYRPVQSVIEELCYCKENYHIDGFYIMDDTFCMDKGYVDEFCQSMKSSKLGLVWAVETRANLVDESMLLMMKDAGLVQIDVGVESGSERMLCNIRKGITVEDVRKIFSLAHKHHVRIFASFILNLPEETREDMCQTVRLLNEIRPSSGVIGTTTPLPKTELFKTYFAHKLKNEAEISELLGRRSAYYKRHDARFHFCDYTEDFDRLIEGLVVKYFFWSELQLGIWYWKVFFRSQRKFEYILSMLHGASNVAQKLAAKRQASDILSCLLKK